MWILCYCENNMITIRFFSKQSYALDYVKLLSLDSYYLSKHFEIFHYFFDE